MSIKDRVSIITHNMNYLIQEKEKRKTDSARIYLKRLKNDMARLSRLETHRHIYDQMQRLFDIEIKVGLEYCRRFRPLTNDFSINLFIFVLYTKTFRDLNKPKRLEIISDIYLLIRDTPKDFKGWKEKGESFNDSNVIETIKKRIQRVSGYFKDYLASKEYKAFEKIRLVMLKEHINNGIFAPMNDKNLKLYIRDFDLVAKIDQRIKETKKQFDGMNILEIPMILDSLKIKDPAANIYKALLADADFINAFRTPIK